MRISYFPERRSKFVSFKLNTCLLKEKMVNWLCSIVFQIREILFMDISFSPYRRRSGNNGAGTSYRQSDIIYLVTYMLCTLEIERTLAIILVPETSARRLRDCLQF
jgi:hypothetical protein